MLKGIVSGEEKDIIRIPMLVGNEYKEGWEVRDNQDRLIWGREDELQTTTGALKLKGYGLPVKVKSLLGNSVQNGTPSPDAPIEPEFCGVRTANQWNGVEYIKTSLNSPETWTYSEDLVGSVYRVPCKPNTTYTLYLTDNVSLTLWRIRDVSTDAVPTAQSTSVQIAASHAESVPSGNSTTFTTSQNAKYILFQTNASLYSSVLNCIMLVEGSTTIPYEPYGWKIPFENHGENLWGKGVPKYVYANDYKKYNSNNAIALKAGTYTISSDGKLPIIQVFDANYTQLNVGDTITYTSGYYPMWDGLAIGPQSTVIKVITITLLSDYVLTFAITDNLGEYIMLNAGSTALPYSPYINETTPIYLGQTPTVRRIKKLVLDGTEYWQLWNGNYFSSVIDRKGASNTILCTHFIDSKAYGISYDIGSTSGLKIAAVAVPFVSSVNDLKDYLAAQYANGTPVTVWYVIAEPKTATVNEPLCKIGDYADELTTIKVHGLSDPLYGIGDYKDILNLSTGVITRKIKKQVFDGSEPWVLSGNIIYIYNTNTEKLSSLICTHFPNEQNTGMWNGNNWVLQVDISNLGMTTRSAWITYLQQQYASGTPVTVWYILTKSETETVTVPTGMTGEIEGYLTQISTPSPTNRSVPKCNGEEETGGTYAVTVYTPPEIPTTTGQNTLTVDTTLSPSSLTVKGHIKEWQPENLLPVSKFEDLSDPSWWSGGYYIRYNSMPAGTYVMSTNMPEKDPGDVYFNGENRLNVPYEGRPVSITINEGDSFYVLFFVDRGGYESILNGTYTITLIKSE